MTAPPHLDGWWTTDDADDVDPALFERSADGTILNSYSGYDDAGVVKRNRGIVYADGFLWGIGNEEAIHKIDPADGSEVSKFATVTTNESDGRGDITYNGTNLVLTERANHSRFEVYSLAGSHIENVPFPAGRDLLGITWDGANYWVGVTQASPIIRMDASFNETLSIQGPTSDNRGLHFRDGYLYVMTADGLYRMAV